MSLLDIRTALYSRVASMPDAIPALQTSKEGVRFEPTPDTPYQALTLIPAEPENPTFGDDYYRENGIFRIRLFYPSRKGLGEVTTQAQKIRSWFYRGLSLPSGDIEVHIQRTPSISEGRSTEDRIVQIVDVRYYVHVFQP